MTNTRLFDVVRCYADGLTQEQTVKRLGISRTLVRHHLKTARRRARDSHYIRRLLRQGEEARKGED